MFNQFTIDRIKIGHFILFISILIYWTILPFQATGDGLQRVTMIKELFENNTISNSAYSIIGPLFASPLYFIDKILFTNKFYFLYRFNFFIFCIGLIFLYNILKDIYDHSFVINFLILLVSGSMFSNHIQDFYGEVYTAIFLAIGFCYIIYKNKPILGSIFILFGTTNIPATLIGISFVSIYFICIKKNVRYILIPIFSLFCIFLENYIRKGNILISGYEYNFGEKTALPYSSIPNFSYPFLFGILSILFSFGKGLIFFTPGIFLPIFTKTLSFYNNKFKQFMIPFILMTIGLILVYSKWWAWYGGLFWGPRFFLIASILSSFMIAILLSKQYKPILSILLITLSIWIGTNGAVFRNENISECIMNKYYLESFCWYIPEFSILWRPFVINKELTSNEIYFLFYQVFVFLYLAIPSFQRINYFSKIKKYPYF